MAWKHLGETFDIHGGGIDLVFPHHENEIAQSRCAFHTPLMARTWMHNGFLQVEGEKMAKSEGNFITIREGLRDWLGAVLRFQMLMTHYRQPIDWTRHASEQAAISLDSFRAHTTGVDATGTQIHPAVLEALADDLNTPRAIAELHKLADEARKGDSQAGVHLSASCGFLGIDVRSVDLQEMLKRKRGLDETKIISLVEARNAARKSKDFGRADGIRRELADMGVELEDKRDGTTTWKLKR
jgi:cysteinyl-tRNA synthetase